MLPEHDFLDNLSTSFSLFLLHSQLSWFYEESPKTFKIYLQLEQDLQFKASSWFGEGTNVTGEIEGTEGRVESSLLLWLDGPVVSKSIP